MAWCGVNWHFGLLDTFVFEENVNQHTYRNLIEHEVLPHLQLKIQGTEIHQVNQYVFQQDGARPHTTNENIQFLQSKFQGVISANGNIHRPSNSPDLTVCDFFLWGRCKTREQAVLTVDEALLDFEDRKTAISIDEVRRAIDNFVRRLRICYAVDGDNFLTH